MATPVATMARRNARRSINGPSTRVVRPHKFACRAPPEALESPPPDESSHSSDAGGCVPRARPNNRSRPNDLIDVRPASRCVHRPAAQTERSPLTIPPSRSSPPHHCPQRVPRRCPYTEDKDPTRRRPLRGVDPLSWTRGFGCSCRGGPGCEPFASHAVCQAGWMSLRLVIVLTVAVAGFSLSACGGGGSPNSLTTTTQPRTALPAAGAQSLEINVAPWRLPAPVSRAVVLTDGQNLLVFGGQDASHNSTATTSQIDPKTGTVTSLGPLLPAVHDAAGVRVGRDDLIIAGGSPPPRAPSKQYRPLVQPSSAASSRPAHRPRRRPCWRQHLCLRRRPRRRVPRRDRLLERRLRRNLA